MSRIKSGTFFLYMVISQIIAILEEWAPTWVAMDWDNVGLQVGDPQRRVSKILVALEVTPKVIDEAISKKADLIITHHPLLFRPLSSVTGSDPIGRMVLKLAENKIALYSAHTNLDFTKGGVSFVLAERLGVQNIRFLKPLDNTLAKIIVFVPETHLNIVRNAMAQAGAGVIGEYSLCSFASKGEGTFVGSSISHPAVGKKEKLEVVQEIRLEMVAPRAKVHSVVSAMKDVHPYEEVAYDVVNLETPSSSFGEGAIGELKKPIPLRTFLKHTKRSLKTSCLRYCGNLSAPIQRVAVCSGAGSNTISDALRSKADVLVTADVGYHKFQGIAGSLALVDAGHWETEQIIVPVIVHRIQRVLIQTNAQVKVYASQINSNSIQMY